MGVINLRAVKDPQERKWVQRVVELTEGGGIMWDFSEYLNPPEGYLIKGEYRGLTFFSSDFQDRGEFEIFRGKERLTRLCYPAVRVLRDFLVELAEENPEVKRWRREKGWELGSFKIYSAGERRQAREYVDRILGV